MKKLKRWGAVVLLAGVICAALVSHDWSKKSVSAANEFLTSLKLAPLPDGVTEAHCKWRGVFAKFANVKFAASREQALEYLKAIPVPHYFEFSAIPGGYQVTATHVLTTAPEQEVYDIPLELKHRHSMLAPPWFASVCDIRHGWFYTFHDHPVHYQPYYDLDAGQFYIYWTYS